MIKNDRRTQILLLNRVNLLPSAWKARPLLRALRQMQSNGRAFKTEKLNEGRKAGCLDALPELCILGR